MTFYHRNGNIGMINLIMVMVMVELVNINLDNGNIGIDQLWQCHTEKVG